jgi:Ca2+/Na+ antiporter
MTKDAEKNNQLLFTEEISSGRTEMLFWGLAIVCLVLFAWRMSAAGVEALGIVFLCLFLVFLFHAVNYRTLVIRITQESLQLRFGVFTWKEQLDNIAECALDEMPWVMRMGGAGIHFMFIRKRYRASFNFLEYARVVIALRSRRGLVRDLSFSTRQPQVVLRVLREAMAADGRKRAVPGG